MQNLNQLIADNLLLVVLAIAALFFFLKPKQAAQPQQATHKGSFNLEFEDELDAAAAQHTPTPAPSKLQSLISLWPEVYMIPLLIAIAALVNYTLLKLFPDAIFLGPEQIQTVLYKTVAAFMAYFFFFIRDRLDFKEAWQWYKSPERIAEYQTLTPWQKRVTFYWRLSVFVIAFALV
jgi:hypothetical protein